MFYIVSTEEYLSIKKLKLEYFIWLARICESFSWLGSSLLWLQGVISVIDLPSSKLVLFQKENFCRNFMINSTLFDNCHGNYVYDNRTCRGYPAYTKLDGSKTIHWWFDGRWYCGTEPTSSVCKIITSSSSPVREKIEGLWKAQSYVNCLDY